jgi:hypothetical protein
MSELSILELEAQHGEVLPEREALSVGFAIGSFNHRTTINDTHNTTTTNTTSHVTSVTASNSSSSSVTNSFLSASRSSASQSVNVNG